MKQPNILWICTDQQRTDTLGCYGNKDISTPHIDGLAEKGVRMENAFCQSPVCTPSRASFLTGRYPRTTRCRQNGQNIPEDEKLVTRLLADAGYVCGLAGKLHLSACHPSAAPVTERRIDDGYVQFHWSHDPFPQWPMNEYQAWLKAKGRKYGTVPSDESAYVHYGMDAEDHQTAWCADKTIEFIKTMQDSGRPWLFSLNLFDPHHPFDPPKEAMKRYVNRLKDMPLPNYREGELAEKSYFQQYDHKGAYGNPREYPYAEMKAEDHRAIRAAYWAMVELIDEQVGRILEALEQTGQAEDTLVIFMSDHGELLGDHGMYLKGPHFYEPSVKVPLIVSMPGLVRENVRVPALAELVDLAPTLMEAAGLPVYPGMQGRSLWPLLTDRQDGEEHRKSVYCEYYNANFKQGGIGAFATMVRTETHKLVKYHRRGEGELYDLIRDPQETVNRWKDPAYRETKTELLDLLCDRMAETVDPLPERIAPW
ncbi:sulfatase-like hydrolase/transferase [Paenibacillus sp. CC-CFT747]|nr:sulfatase-like hydrolase/transferase [Paenibacillus sp. CC-CFT747]